MIFLENLDPILKTYWYVAIAASVVFIIQTIMTFLGSDGTDGNQPDFDADFDGADAPFQLFSLRNLVNFLLGFSWTGISFYDSIPNKIMLTLVALGVGLLFVYLFFIIINQVRKLAEDNSFKIMDTINKSAEVYLSIPENKSGKGKVMISVNGAFHELDAMTYSEMLPTNTIVKVISIDHNNILIVEKI